MDKGKYGMQQRIEWIDTMRGLAIVMVIYGHINRAAFVSACFYCFHIPLLFWISGYLFKFDSKTSFKEFIFKKLYSIALPCVMLSLVIAIVQIIKNGWSDYEYLVQCLAQIRTWTLWYMACLFILNLMLYWALRAFKESFIALVVLSFVTIILGNLYYTLGGVGLIWNADVALMAFPFFAFGYWSKTTDILSSIHQRARNIVDARFVWKKEKHSNQVADLCMRFVGCGCVLFSIAMGYISKEVTGGYYSLDMYGNAYACLPITYISAFAGIVGMVLMLYNLNIPILNTIGKHSIIYFAWHYAILLPIIGRLLEMINLTGILADVIKLVFACVVSELIYRLLELSKIGFLFGVKYKRREEIST